MFFNKIPYTWFDVVVILVVFYGISLGRKNGISQEWFPCLKWLVMIVTGALTYRVAGDLLYTQLLPLNLNLGRSICYICVYLAVIFVCKIIFDRIYAALPEAWTKGSDFFGKWEYYLGMLGGVLHVSCILLAALAIINCPHYSSEEIVGGEQFQQAWFGTNLFPDFQTFQRSIFKQSFVGNTVLHQADGLLMASYQPTHRSRH